MQVLVTGGSGLVGRAIWDVLPETSLPAQGYRFHFVSSADGDLRDFEQVNSLFHKIRPDIVVHLAACVGGLFKNLRQNLDMFENNLLINFNVIRVCRQMRVKKVISCLSTCVFPDGAPLPMSEQDLHLGPPHRSNQGYAYAKRMLELHSRLAREEDGLDCVCLVPTNVYGPHDNFELNDAHVIPALIHKAVLAKKSGGSLAVAGSGSPLRQFVFSQDLARCILRVVARGHDLPPSLIIAPPEELSIAEVAGMIAEELGIPLRFQPELSDGQRRKTVSNAELLRTFPDFEFVPIKFGLKKTIQWFQENYDRARR
ncbi:MAG: NAD-dependent epimerase/dehydratase family protein [Sulfobacillus sp.]